ncbi:MAG: threonine--tRNA ligase, partial [Desulfovibrio sp.]|nr:threonine--tRNA ligase [Desulfovibrio sp.]
KNLRDELRRNGVRVSLDERNEKLGFKVREAQLAKIPYILVIGEKEAQAGGAAVRLRNGENLGIKTAGEIMEMVHAESEEPFQKGGMNYRFA